ncbi:MAG: cyclic nucleotide-binding domain-containing protein [Acidobacteria bacterium]|nr:cyclic nucleotide-binding domain-containing protein [Acidobacteriota bacterium]
MINTDNNELKNDRVMKLKASILFRTCNQETLKEIETELTDIFLEKDKILFREGDIGDCLYVVINGKLAVYTTDKSGQRIVIDEKFPGSCVGEIALLTGQLRSASVYALENTNVMALSKEGFAKLANKIPGLVTTISNAILPNLQMSYLAPILAELFKLKDIVELQNLESEIEWKTLAKGEALFHQGDIADGMYIVVTGRLQIFIQDENKEEQLHSEVGTGEVIGEIALLTEETRSATIYALRETNVVKLSASTFEKLIDKYPKMMVQITRMIVARQQQMLANKISNIRSYNYALIPLSKDISIKDLLVELAKATSVFGTVMMLDANKFDQLYGIENASKTDLESPLSFVINKCLTDLAARYKYLIYGADFDWTPWTQRCISQADRILLVANAKDDPSLRRIEEIIQERFNNVQTELVLLHSPEINQPSNTTSWLTPRKVFSHHHLRKKDSQHIRRLARHLTNNTIGLVLSGGGARGFAHVGVIKAFYELGIEIDSIAGTSMGSLVAAAYATKLDAKALLEISAKFASAKQLFDFTLPIVSLMSSGKVTHVMEELFEDTLIEDLWNPFFCVSSNLSHAAPIIHRQGLLRRAVRASISIPMVFSPVVFDGDVVVDGGIMNNFPVDIMRKICQGGTVIGVTVAPPSDKVRTFGYDDSVSGWKILLNKLNPMSEKEAVPSLVWTILRSMEVNNVYLQNQMDRLTDLLIRPNVGKFGILDFGSFEPIVQIGYETALPKLKEWLPKYLIRYHSK